MSENEENTGHNITEILVEQVIPTVFVALIVGGASSYFTARMTIAEMKKDIETLRRRVNVQKETDQQIRERRNKITKQLSSIETKVDLLMKNKGLVDQ